MTSDSPCIAELRKQTGANAAGVASVIQNLVARAPLIRCHRDDESAQLVAVNLAAILAHVFPSIGLDIPHAGLSSRVQAIIRAVNPNASATAVPSVMISIGEPHPGAYMAIAAGWQVGVASPGQAPPTIPAGGANPASALLAATLVAARVLADTPQTFDARSVPTATRLNLWSPDLNQTGPDIPRPLQVDAHVFGHGSISNALWGALDHWTIAGSLTVVDYDKYEPHNAARYTFLPANQIGALKVMELGHRLAHHSALTVTPRPETVQEWSRRLEPAPRLAVISPDNKLARAWAADSLPRIAIAASASDREAQVAYCSPEGICSYCLFAPGHVTPGSQRDAIVAFTGLVLGDVVAFTREWNGQPPLPLNEAAVRIIEAKMGKTRGAFEHWVGKLLLDFLKVHQAALYSAVVVRTGAADRVHLPLPLASAAAGALAMAGLLRMSLQQFDYAAVGFNHLRLNVWSGELQFILETRPASMTCLCQNAARQQWRATSSVVPP